ncbi:MAG: S-methyl-5-thioribose-1-phosphate isomerase [PVC group bacterium]|nr:S-methyl-5-thioribose-1-phosphate isomerase [PVC group bacterium]
MKIETIKWDKGAVKIIDQTKLPQKLIYVRCVTVKQVWDAIRILKVRGAPAIGAAAALGVVLGISKKRFSSFNDLRKEVDKLVKYLASARPTAVNLFWALERMKSVVLKNKLDDIKEITQKLIAEASAIIDEDKRTCRKMAQNAQVLIKKNDRILTYCNAGILATVDYGTALGCIYRANELKKNVKVYSCETRPLLQGARLTCWELNKKGVDVTLICDSMAGYLMQQKKIDKIFIGADRIAANGDAANKIGSYSVSVLANFHKIPFYVAAPLSTFDVSLKDGNQIPIEQRSKSEVSELFFKRSITAKGVDVYNPAFDVVPAKLISGIVTEAGVITPPFPKKIARLFKS